MSREYIVRSTCDLCSSGCGVIVHIKDGLPIRIEGDPESPVSCGVLCTKGQATLEYFYSPYRLRRPLRKIGNRDSGEWEEISWDTALDTIAEKLQHYRSGYGAESVAFISGSNKGTRDIYLVRFANAFGSPNHFWSGYTCFMPRMFASQMTYGYLTYPDFNHAPKAILVWGSNVRESRYPEYFKTVQLANRGTRLAVIDPVENDLTDMADIWLKIKPGADLALALGLINVIIREKLYDEYFVENWTMGFAELKQHVIPYSPEAVEKLTWVKAEDIEKLARFYAQNKPAFIQWGNGLDTNNNGFQACRAISILRAITGNIGIEGGELKYNVPVMLSRPETRLDNLMEDGVWAKRVEAGNKMLPLLKDGSPPYAVKSMLKGEPYKIRAAYIQGCNPLASWADSYQAYEGLKELEFLAVADLFMTPTAAIADMVLPVATYLEFDGAVTPPYYPACQVQQKVAAEKDESRSDFKILSSLAGKMGITQFKWESETEALDNMLEPAGVLLDELRTSYVLPGLPQYRDYLEKGFPTKSGKAELFSERLAEWGFDPLPVYREIPETSPDDVKEDNVFVMTSSKLVQFRHSGGKQISVLRGSHPDPVVSINTRAAARLGITEGESVLIENNGRTIKQKAHLNNQLHPKVIIADYGWWFPESGWGNMYGWAESNVNVLTSNVLLGAELGTPNFRGIAVKLAKITDDLCREGGFKVHGNR